ncbi:HNH endonuclease [Streptomyces sp. CFMR 7]|uniref:HNH endonuclease n=1 Tax=Streptomyces sp. CFMR 7 TaxID=1649184 RepID=UPI0011A1CFCA|nr:HNH endonuclease [Streptomyces sp. CFMR 7]
MASASQVETEARFWSKVAITDGCWTWTAGVHRSGYGVFSVQNKQTYAHRYAYMITKGSIPQDLVLDHVCHGRDATCVSGEQCQHRRCVRPDHFEAISHGENTRRGNTLAAANVAKTHCPAGHPYGKANTYITPEGWRSCRPCRREREVTKAAVTS